MGLGFLKKDERTEFWVFSMARNMKVE